VCESEPGSVTSERDAGAVPVVDGAVVVGEQGGGEKVDEERDVARGADLHGHHVGGVTRVVEVVRFEASVEALLGAALAALEPAELAVLGDEAVAVVALVEGDDDEVLGGCGLVVRVLDEALGEADHELVVGALAAAVEEEGDGDRLGRGLAGRDRGEAIEAVDGDWEAADDEGGGHL